ncbi:unnamed protein product [Merluccius merluccius]
MLAVCESCLPTLSKLRESVSSLRADLMERDKILMDFSVTTTQVKLIARLKTSGADVQNMTAMDNTTLPWTGSITTGTPALAESRWHRQGAKPRASAPSSSCFHPAESQCFIRDREDRVESTASSTPLKPREPWSVVCRGAGARPSPPSPPPPGPQTGLRFRGGSPARYREAADYLWPASPTSSPPAAFVSCTCG